MTSNWKKCKIGDLCATISDTYKGDDEKVVLINTSDVLEGKILNHELIDNKNLKGQFKKTFQKNDILYSEIRPANKRFAFVDIEYTANYIASTKLMVIRPYTDLVLPQYLYMILKSQPIIDELQHLAETRSGTFPQITFSAELAPMDIKIPPLETQQKIAKVLSAIDDKIELNNSINNNLEQQAQAIFKSWFVDFEPFGGTMPDNWKVVDLGDICNISAGGDKPSKFSVIQTQEFQIPIYSNGINNEGLYGYTNYAKINNESVTISARGTIGYTCLRLNPFFPIVRLICIEPKNRLFSAKYLYQAIKRMDIVGFGTTQQQITVPYCKTLKILLPSKEYLYKYANIVDRLYKEIFENKNENIKLIQLRDTILPKLMNGEIDVSKVDISADKLLF